MQSTTRAHLSDQGFQSPPWTLKQHQEGKEHASTRARSPACASLQESTTMLRGDLTAAQHRTPLLQLPLAAQPSPTPPPPERHTHARTDARVPPLAFRVTLY